MKAQTILAGISSLALMISLATLWQSHLSKFRPVTAAGPLTLRICQIESSGKSWFISQADCRLSITNAGARVGKVLGMRMMVRYPGLPIPDAHEYFLPHSEVEPVRFKEHAKNRFIWIKKASLGEATPFVILPRSSVSKHVVFDKRWDDPVIQEEIQFILEILTDRDTRWITVERWMHRLDGSAWSQLTEVGGSIRVEPASVGDRDSHDTVPTNLHEFTRGKKSIPKGGFGSHASRLVSPSKPPSKNEEEGSKEGSIEEDPE
ncbi:hypothetical protein ACFWVU_22685 [Streptomyces sp. NPDC058686]|uniref:hypothetical protein n=1 Tax=Streptomyces sp. NPDC058686 TaxID=3346599 RepID=UPI003657DE67